VVVADNTPPTKSSTYARFQERREVVVTNNTPPLKSSIRARCPVCVVTNQEGWLLVQRVGGCQTGGSVQTRGVVVLRGR
jgi:hypothetical protein